MASGTRSENVVSATSAQRRVNVDRRNLFGVQAEFRESWVDRTATAILSIPPGKQEVRDRSGEDDREAPPDALTVERSRQILGRNRSKAVTDAGNLDFH